MTLQIHVCKLDFHFTLHFIYKIHMAHNSDVALDNPWHDLTWHCWHGLDWWGVNVKKLLFLSDICVLGHALSSPPHGLMMQGLQWSFVLRGGCMHVFPLLVLGNILCLSRCMWVLKHLFSFFSFFIISPWSNGVPIPTIHSLQDDI